MPHQPFDFQDLLQLVELMKSTTQFSEFKLRAGDIELELRRGPAGGLAPVTAAASSSPPPAPAVLPPREQSPAQVIPPPPAAAPRVHSISEGLGVVKAPMVGTVYLAPEPGAPPFVTVGQPVEAGTQVCIVEVMKLMNSVTAGCRGVVREILVGDGEAVEFGQALFVITPA